MDQAHTLRRLTAILLLCAWAGCAMQQPVHYASRSDDRDFYIGRIREQERFPSEMKEIHAGIVSHHLFAAEYISRFFSTIREAPGGDGRRTFVILGPDHRKQSRAMTAASRRPWKTPFGECRPDLPMIARLCVAGMAEVDEEAFTGEHSIGALLPFIAYYFPRSKVVPLVLNYRMSWEQARQLGRSLAACAGAGDIIILSADFVHDKKSSAARGLDRRTKTVLARYRGDPSIDLIKNAEIDCRKGLLALLAFTNARNTGDVEILLNTDSAILARRDVPATSYFFVLYGNKRERKI